MLKDDRLASKGLSILDLLLKLGYLLFALLFFLFPVVHLGGFFIYPRFQLCDLVHLVVGHAYCAPHALRVFPDLGYLLSALLERFDFFLIR